MIERASQLSWLTSDSNVYHPSKVYVYIYKDTPVTPNSRARAARNNLEQSL